MGILPSIACSWAQKNINTPLHGWAIDYEPLYSWAKHNSTIENLYDIAYKWGLKGVAQCLSEEYKYKNREHLDPIFKWTGGKRREIKHFNKFFPDFISNGANYTYVEPFAGGAAVYWYLNNFAGKNVINDFDDQLVNFYSIFASGDSDFVNQLRKIASISDHDKLEKAYYEQRNKDKNGGLKNVSKTEMAVRFFVVNQLAFSGMRRFNSDGEFNVPFGHYKHLNANVIDSALTYAKRIHYICLLSLK
jgi:DNA adenine methylase Dam